MLKEKSWLPLLSQEFDKDYMKRLKAFLAEEIKNKKVFYPPVNLVFNAFEKTPYDKVRVVIIGQDPYHQEGQAHGLSFSVPFGVKIPPSLNNIYKELKDDLKIPIAKTGCLESWCKEGVLLLNATLTVRAGEPKSHYGQGWEEFTDVVCEKLLEKKDPIVFILWGKSAQEKVNKVLSKTKNHQHLILQAAHPSFYSVSGFWGCKHFSQTNKFFEKLGLKPINWAVE
jgi:uracil-DNA glycosylase